MRKPARPFLPNLWPFHHPHTPGQPAARPFRAAQIEVTSRCNLECTFCALRALGDSWIKGDLPLPLYREFIAPHLDLFELVYLQGWGEPLLHPGLWEMVRLAREKGCRTGFTTNGAHLGEDERRLALETGVDLLSVSFAGAHASTHTGARTRSDWENLLANVEELAELKLASGSEKPWLEFHFLMTNANLEELPDAVHLAASLGVNEFVATNLTYTPNQAMDKLRAFGSRPPAKAEDLFASARSLAEAYGLRTNLYPLEMQKQVLVCDARPQETVFINQLGEVTPCVVLGLCALQEIPRYYFGKSYPTSRVSFGHVKEGLPQVLEGAKRREFVEPFRRREISTSPLASFGYILGAGASMLPDPPEPCRACYKMHGV